jgi:hydrogenase maturation factor
MSEKARIGKVSDEIFTRVILPNLGAKDPRVLLGPKMGCDAAVIDLGPQKMVIAEDPIFPVPGLPLSAFGWFTVHIGASDVAVMGVRPRHMTYTLLAPPETPEAQIEEIAKSIGDACSELGISVVGGHTGLYPGFAIPIIGGVTVIGYGEKVVTPSGAQVGDSVIVTKGAAVEAAGILATVFGEKMKADGVGAATVDRAAEFLWKMSVIKDCDVAVSTGEVHAMHDATEGGVIRGLYEVAEASGVGMRIDGDAVIVDPSVRATCDYFGIDPMISISEGTLVLTCAPGSSDSILAGLREAGIEASRAGEVVELASGRWISWSGKETDLSPPDEDPFWAVYFSQLAAT